MFYHQSAAATRRSYQISLTWLWSTRARVTDRTATKLCSAGFELTAVLTFGLRVRRLNHSTTRSLYPALCCPKDEHLQWEEATPLDSFSVELQRVGNSSHSTHGLYEMLKIYKLYVCFQFVLSGLVRISSC